MCKKKFAVSVRGIANRMCFIMEQAGLDLLPRYYTHTVLNAVIATYEHNTQGVIRNKCIDNRNKIIVQINGNNEVISSFIGLKDVINKTGYSKGYISNCLNGKYKKAYGYKWSYDE